MINCKKAQSMISLYIDKQLNDNDRKDFLKHIENCEKCRIEKEEIECIVQMCKDIGEEELPSGFKESLRAKLQEEAARRTDITELSKKDADSIDLDVTDINAAYIKKDKNRKGSYTKKYMRIFASIAAVLTMFILIKGFYPQLLNSDSYTMKNSVRDSGALENTDGPLSGSGSKVEKDKNTSSQAMKSDEEIELTENKNNKGASANAGSDSAANQESGQGAGKMSSQADSGSMRKDVGESRINDALEMPDSLMRYSDSAEISNESEYSIAAQTEQEDRSSGYGITALMDTKSYEVDPESLYASEGNIVDRLEMNIYSYDMNKETDIIRNLISEISIEEYTDEMYNVPSAKPYSGNIVVINIMVPETRFKEFISIIDGIYPRENLTYSPMQRTDVEGILLDYEKRISEIDKRLNELEQQNVENGEKNNLKIEKDSIIENSNKIRISTLYVFVNMYIHQK